MRYKRYDERTKILISKSKNPYLFPELNIPVSTAKEWIKKRLHLKLKYQPIDRETLKVTLLRKENELLKDEIRELNRRVSLLKLVAKALGSNISSIRITDSIKRNKVVNLIQKHKGRKSIRSALNDLDITFSKYKRWSKEIFDRRNFTNDIEKYRQFHQRSLSVSELKILLSMYEDPKLFHLPLHALSTLARRLDLVHCSTRTWSKYAKVFKVKRPMLKIVFQKGYAVGISKEYSNQLWHMDVTEIKIRGKKVFLQVILDNYSRFIIDWSLMTMWNGQSSSELIERAIQRHGTPLVLMTDGGKENLNYIVSNTLKRYSIKHLVSKMNTHYSNSRVEAFFRMLKHNYLKKVKYTSTIKLKEHINTYILDYNYKIPHSALCGRTPEEAYFGMPKDYYNDHFKEKVREAIQKRVKEYKNST